MNLNEILTPPVAAQLYNISPETVKKACRTGKIPTGYAKKIGGIWIITKAGMRLAFGAPPTPKNL